HSHRICHRDIKSPNVLVDESDCRLRLCDFGSARSCRCPANLPKAAAPTRPPQPEWRTSALGTTELPSCCSALLITAAPSTCGQSAACLPSCASATACSWLTTRWTSWWPSSGCWARQPSATCWL
ncbi:hypothetical protein BOX15_Mlig023110g2, partial [Macrostomum lignano]